MWAPHRLAVAAQLGFFIPTTMISLVTLDVTNV